MADPVSGAPPSETAGNETVPAARGWQSALPWWSKIAAKLPDGSGLAPISGSIKGSISVGEAPAGPAQKVEPGTPAKISG